MQDNLWHHKLFHFHLPFWIWKVWKGREKMTKIEYLENEKSFLDEIKNIFHSFWKPIFCWKNKNLIKNSGHKLWRPWAQLLIMAGGLPLAQYVQFVYLYARAWRIVYLYMCTFSINIITHIGDWWVYICMHMKEGDRIYIAALWVNRSQ